MIATLGGALFGFLKLRHASPRGIAQVMRKVNLGQFNSRKLGAMKIQDFHALRRETSELRREALMNLNWMLFGFGWRLAVNV